MPRPQAERRSRPKVATAGVAGPPRSRPRLLPGLREITDPRGPYLVPLVLLVLSRAVLLLRTPTSSEDAFITFRYARNLASGLGLVYNRGEHVMGFTSPLWTLWSAVGCAVVGNPVPWALLWSFLADVFTLLAGGALVATTVGTASALAFTFFFAAWPYFSALTVSGMEMSVCLALLLLAGILVHRRSRVAGPALAALAFMRPEAFVAAAVLSLAATWRDRLVALGLCAAGVTALALRFGSAIPNSVRAKADIYGLPGPWVGRNWWEWISPVVMGRWPTSSDGVMMMFLVVVTAPAVILGARELWRSRESALARIVAALVVIWLGYAVMGVAYFWWYLAFPLMAVALLGAVGLPRVIRGRAIPAALVLFVLSGWSIALSLYTGRAFGEANIFATMASTLHERCRPGETVMLEPIGMIGYTCPVVVIDETGLVSPEVTRRRMQGPGWYTDLVAERKPDWLVVRRGVMNSQDAFAGAGHPFRSTAERDAILARYPLVATSGDVTSENSLMLLHRQP